MLIANTLFQQHKKWLYTWTSPDGQYWNETDYILCSWRWRSSIRSAKIRPRADCDSDHELFTAKFRLKLKKVGKVIRPFRYDLNQILYDYTVKVTNRFKALDLIGRVPEELWMEWHCTGGNDQDHPQEKGMQKGKTVVWGGLTNSREKKRCERQKRKGKGKVKSLSRVWLFATPCTVAHQAPPSMGFSRQQYWSGLPFPSPGIFLTQGSNPGPPHCRQMPYHLSHQGSPRKGKIYPSECRVPENSKMR